MGGRTQIVAMPFRRALRTERRRRTSNRWYAQPTAVFSGVILACFVLAAVIGEWFAPYGSNESTGVYFASPSKDFPLGTDNLGRDVLSRTIIGARVSLQVGFLALAMGTISGAMFGIITGYFGGIADAVGQRIIDVLMALPGILLALVIAAGMGASLFNVAVAIAVAILPVSARVARASTLATESRPFIEAARASGAGDGRILARHVLPNVMAPVMVIASVQLGFAIITEASLSFLGLGIPLGTPSWGNMLSGSALLYVQNAPWMGLGPGIALTLVIMATNLLGDTLRDVLDPRMRGFS